MAQITEDYVSFETAKLLKEKGFDISTNYSYGNARAYKGRVIDLDTECELKDRGLGDKIMDVMIRYQLWWTKDTDYSFPCPTQQMAMRWLREVHNIDIVIDAAVGMLGVKVYVPFISTYKPLKDGPSKVRQLKRGICYKDDKGMIPALQQFDSYEQACEVAIKYCLENLI